MTELSNMQPADMERIHYFAAPDTNVLLDINSGSIFRVDHETIAVLECLKENNGHWDKTRQALAVDKDNGDKQEILADLAALTAEGQLFAADAYVGKYQPPAPVLKSLCINICHDCDLRCRYCFASTGSFGGKRTKMPFAVGAKALDYLLEHSGHRKFLEVDFFGGEPLMNIDVVRQLVDYGRQREKAYGKTIRFTFTTNCVSLDEEIMDWAINNDISVVLSHDGRKEIHDAMRCFPDGSGSHDVISKNIQRFLAKDPRGTAIVRGTYTAHNKDFTEDIKHWLDLGYQRLSMEPAVELYGDRKLQAEDLPALRREYWKLAQFYLQRKAEGKPFDFFHFNIDIEHGPCLPKRLTGCGAGYEYMVVTPEGDFYPCHQFVGRESYLLGDVDNGVQHPEISEQFRQCHVYTKEACAKCWARFYCSGGCHANADLFHQDIYQPYEMGCELAKIRTECAIWLAVSGRA